MAAYGNPRDDVSTSLMHQQMGQSAAGGFDINAKPMGLGTNNFGSSPFETGFTNSRGSFGGGAMAAPANSMPGMSNWNQSAGAKSGWGGAFGGIASTPIATPPPSPPGLGGNLPPGLGGEIPARATAAPPVAPPFGGMGDLGAGRATVPPPTQPQTYSFEGPGAFGRLSPEQLAWGAGGGRSMTDDSGMWRAAGLSSPTSPGRTPLPAFTGRASPEQLAAMNAPQAIFGDWGGSSGGIGRRADGSSFAPVPLTGQFQD